MPDSESAARRALGAQAVESRRGLIIETVTPDTSEPPGGARYTRRGYKAPPGKRLWEATSTGGFISVRASGIEMRYATNVIDLAGGTERARAGVIRSFFNTRDEAVRQADALRDDGYLVTIVDARPYAGQPGDADA